MEEILESAHRIQTYTSDLTYDQFLEDGEKQDAVIRRMEIIGEAVKGLPDGRQIVFSAGEKQDEIWVMEGAFDDKSTE